MGGGRKEGGRRGRLHEDAALSAFSSEGKKRREKEKSGRKKGRGAFPGRRAISNSRMMPAD